MFNTFFVLGLLVCLLSAYINSFLISLSGMNTAEASIKIIPICEELLKALPIFFYTSILKPKKKDIISASLAIGLGFALLENGCYITQYGANNLMFVIIRGFSAGTMHALCSIILGYGIALIYNKKILTYTGSFALICATSTSHATYNLLVSSHDNLATIGYVMPIAISIIVFYIFKRLSADLEQ